MRQRRLRYVYISIFVAVYEGSSHLTQYCDRLLKIAEADEVGLQLLDALVKDEEATKAKPGYGATIQAYTTAFSSCALVLELDKCAFQAEWFGDFYRRNYDALMVKSLYDNVIDDVDNVREW